MGAAGTRDASAIAVQPTSCVMVSGDDILAALRSTPELAVRMPAGKALSVIAPKPQLSSDQ